MTEKNPPKRPEPERQWEGRVVTTASRPLSEEAERFLAALDAELVRDYRDWLRRRASQHDRLPNPPVSERQDERDADQDE